MFCLHFAFCLLHFLNSIRKLRVGIDGRAFASPAAVDADAKFTDGVQEMQKAKGEMQTEHSKSIGAEHTALSPCGRPKMLFAF
jgi:hypothetical protein